MGKGWTKGNREGILDFALLQMVHVDVYSICSPHGQLLESY